MEHRSRFATKLRSINALTGALLGCAAAVAFIFSGLITEHLIGRPSPDQMAGLIIFVLPYMGVLFAVPGALIGWIIHLILNRTALAGREHSRLVAAGFALVVILAGISGFNAVHRSEAKNKPAIHQTNGTVTRLVGSSPLTPLTPATLLYLPFPTPPRSVAALNWRDRSVKVELEDEILTISQDGVVTDKVSLKGLDYVNEVQGVTATLEGGGSEWFALLVRLRATGRRELLLIYNPAGELAHRELLSRTKSGPELVLWSTGELGDVQELMLNLGEPLRYIVQR